MSDNVALVSRRRKVEYPFHYSPDGKLVHVVAELHDKPGTLALLLNALGGKVNLIGTTSYVTDGGTAVFSGFGRVLSKNDTAQSIQKLVSEYHSVLGCEVWESSDGLIVDRFHTGLQTGLGEHYTMFPTTSLAKAFEEVVRVFGSGGATILYFQGLDFAKARWSQYSLMLGPHPEKRIEEAASILESFGYGSITASSDPYGWTLTLEVRDCFECSVGTENKRRCEFLRGMIVGLFGGMYGKRVACQETKCRLKGDKVCEFIVKAEDGQSLSQISSVPKPE
jgi:predicted hydrocarbon binding protein